MKLGASLDIVAAVSAGAALAAQQSGFTRTLLQDQPISLAGHHGVTARVDIGPGVESGRQTYCHVCHAPASATTRVGHGTVESCSLDASRRTAPRSTSRRTPHRPPLDLAIGAGSDAQKTQGNYCTMCCTIPDTGG
jgi:hypothetical protein